MAFSIRDRLANSVQRLRDSTDLDERAGSFVNRKLKPIAQNFQYAGRNLTTPSVYKQNFNEVKRYFTPKALLGGNQAELGAMARDTLSPNNRLGRNALEFSNRIPGAITQGLSFGLVNPLDKYKPQTAGGMVGDFVGNMAGFGRSPITKGILSATNPIASRAVNRLSPRLAPVAGTLAPRLSGSIANTVQGFAFDAAQRQLPTPTSIGLDVATGFIGGANQFDDAIKGTVKSNFSLDPKTFDELIEAEEMIKNPDWFVGKITTNTDNIKDAKRIIRERGIEIVERISAKHLPDKQIYGLKTTQAKINALFKLSKQNKLANVPGMGLVAEGPRTGTRFKPPYQKGDLQKLESKLDNLLGTDSYNMTGRWKDKIAARKTALEELRDYASSGDTDAKKYLKEAENLTNQIDLARGVKNKDIKSSEVRDFQKSFKPQSKQNTPSSAFHSTASLEIEGGKLRASVDGSMGPGVYLHKNQNAAREAGAMQADGNLADQNALKVKINTDKLFKWPGTEYPEPNQVREIKNKGYDGIIEEGGEIIIFDPEKVTLKSFPPGQSEIQKQVYNASAKPGTVTKILKRNRQALEKSANQDYREWQRQVFKQEAPRTATGAVNDAVKAIKTQSNSPISNPQSMNDISGFSANFKDVYRNFKSVYGKNFDQVKKAVLDPFDRSKGAMVDEQVKLLDNLDEKIVKGLGIKKGSKLSALTQLWGEGKITEQELKAAAGSDYNKVIEADKFFRSEYDRLLDEVNATRRRIYPTSPEKIIPKRKDYYRHYREVAQGISGLKNIFDSPANISSSLAGTSDFTKPKSKWLSFAQRRLGDKTDIDAVGGYLDYIKASTYAKHIDPHTATFRNLAEEIARNTEDGTQYARKMDGFIEYLNDFSNDLAGKTNAFDRALQKVAGRKAFKVLNWANNRVKANVILGNASSAIAQLFNIPQGIANAGPRHAVVGAGRSLASILGEDKTLKQSDFIKERYASSNFDRFDTGMIDNARKFASWFTSLGDEIGTKYIWNMHYSKALSEGVQNPIKYADDVTRRMVAGRGIGEVPLVQKAKTFQLIAPFQLEVANLWFVMKDFVDEKAFGKIATLFIANHLMNKGAEQIRGSGVTFDPIQAMIDSYESFEEEENKRAGAIRAGGRIAGEVLSNLPIGQSVAGAYDEYGGGFVGGGVEKLTGEKITRKELFGDADPTRFGSGLLVSKGLQDPVFKLVPPFGGNQIKRTIEGIQTTNRGYSQSKTGRVRFPTENNTPRNIQRAVFGQYSTPNARAYFDEDRTPLGENQSSIFKQLGNSKEYYDKIISDRKQNASIQKAKDKLKAGDNDSSKVGDAILIKTPNGDIETIYPNKPVNFPKLSGQSAVDKKLLSQYKGNLTSKENDIIKLYGAGHLTPEQAEQQLQNIQIIRDFLSEVTKKPSKGKSVITRSELLAQYRRALKAQLGLTSTKTSKSSSQGYSDYLRQRRRSLAN